MLVSERKPWEEILQSLGTRDRIFVVSCGGCADACETGGNEGLVEAKTKLQEAGKQVTGAVLVDYLCNKVLVGIRMGRYIKELEGSDLVLVLSCGVGVQVVGAMVDLPVHPADNTLFMGGFTGVWPGAERCAQCGECRLGVTGGICPVTNCTKELLNGPCGGSNNGKCEVDPEKDCGWMLIYERLKRLGRLEDMKEIRPARDHKLMEPPPERRKTIYWALENVE